MTSEDEARVREIVAEMLAAKAKTDVDFGRAVVTAIREHMRRNGLIAGPS